MKRTNKTSSNGRSNAQAVLDMPRDKEYRLCNGRSGVAVRLKTGEDGKLRVFDEKEQRFRAIRHCPNEKSIYLEEQDKDSAVTDIFFEFGRLTVPGREVMTQKFLDANPANIVNGGRSPMAFEEINEEKEAQEDLAIDDMLIDIKHAVREKLKEKNGIDAIEAIVGVFRGSVEEAFAMSEGELRRAIYQEIDANPHRFVNEAGDVTIFENGDVFRKHLIMRALKDGIIRKSSNGRALLWEHNKKQITEITSGVDFLDYVSDFLTTNEGMLVAEEIAKRG